MTASFELDPSPYHLGTCNLSVTRPDGSQSVCGRPAVVRAIGGGPAELLGDWRRCAEHAPKPPG